MYQKMNYYVRMCNLDMQSCRNTYIGDEGSRGVSGGERRRVSIGIDIIHGPSLLFLDEPTSGLDSTSAHSVMEKVHDIARSGSTVILTIHQPSSRIQLLLDHLIILARGQLMYQGPPKDVALHLERMSRKLPKGENAIECFIDVVQEYDQSAYGVDALAEFALTGVKPPLLVELSASHVKPTAPPPGPKKRARRLHLESLKNGFDHSVRSPWNKSNSWSTSQPMIFTPTRKYADQKSLALTR